MLLIPVMGQDGEPIDLFDAVVRDGNAACRSAVAMKKNVSPWALVRTKDAVGSIRITNMEAQEEIALRIEPIQFVKPFWHLFVPKAALRPQCSRRGANSILVHQHVRLIVRTCRPKF